MNMYRTKTYIAGAWDEDSDAIEQLYNWNSGKRWGLSFHSAHDLTQSRDSSLKCSIKKSLKARLDCSKTFVLVVGEHTKYLRQGSCALCDHYNRWNHYCTHGNPTDNKSFIEYECDEAEKAADGGKMNLIILYNSSKVDLNKCPEVLRNALNHVQMKQANGRWDYAAVKRAFDVVAGKL